MRNRVDKNSLGKNNKRGSVSAVYNYVNGCEKISEIIYFQNWNLKYVGF